MLTDRHVDRYRHVDRQTCRQIEMYKDRHVNRQTCRQIDMQTDRHVNRQTCIQIDMQTDRHVDRQTCIKIDNVDIQTYSNVEWTKTVSLIQTVEREKTDLKSQKQNILVNYFLKPVNGKCLVFSIHFSETLKVMQ